MKGSRRRVLGRAAAAATGAVLLVSATAFAADTRPRPEDTGNGIKTGQMGVQLFNYGGFINNGGGQVPGTPPAGVDPADVVSPIAIDRVECRQGGAQATSTDCRWYRLELLFAFLKSKGATNVELFGHSAFPASTATGPACVAPNDPVGCEQFGLRAYRALLDKYGLHAGGWHGDMSESGWDTRVNAGKILGADYIGSGGFPAPDIGSYANTLATAQALNRLGKRSVEAGLGPAYFHNHQNEFANQYVDDGVLKTAFDIVMERTDPRYVVAEIDVKWSSDFFGDVTGTQTAALINKWGTRVQLLHIKDGTNLAAPFPASAPHISTGDGELDFRPIFAAAEGKVRYYHQEHDGGTLFDANRSLSNLKGINTAVTGTVFALPTTFPSVAANTPAASNVVPIVISNTGDAPLTINPAAPANQNGLTIVANALDTPVAPASDFQIISDTCRGQTLAPGTATTPRGSCVVNVGFGPSKAGVTSVARLMVRSNADDATEQILLVGKSTNSALGTIGGDVPSLLQLVITNNGGHFGTFVPGVARTYDTALAATVTTTTGDAALAVTDPSATASGRLVNGAFSLASPVNARAVGSGDSPAPAFAALPTDGSSLLLRSWSTPVTAAPLTLGFRQSIGAAEVLRAGTYSKTLTFTLSTTTP
jgi:sugar phosphate isomerase/epimerase